MVFRRWGFYRTDADDLDVKDGWEGKRREDTTRFSGAYRNQRLLFASFSRCIHVAVSVMLLCVVR